MRKDKFLPDKQVADRKIYGGNKMKKCIDKIVLPILVFLLMAGFVHAAATFAQPTSGSAIRGDSYFNVSSGLTAPLNCSITGSSTNSSDTLSATWLYNNTPTDSINATISTTSLNDADDWTFSGTCYNATTSESLTAITGVIVDNTVPKIQSCTIDGSTASNTTVSASSFTLACDVGNATICSVYWRGASQLMSSDSSYTDCTFTGTSSFDSDGTSASCILSGTGDDATTAYFTCGDGSNSTTTSYYSITSEGVIIDGTNTEPGGATTTGGDATTTGFIGKLIASVTNLLQNKIMFVIMLLLIAAFLLVVVSFMKQK